MTNAELPSTRTPSLRADEILRHLATVTATRTGTDFFCCLVQEVGLYLSVSQVFITERPDPQSTRISTLSMWKYGVMQPSSTYPLDDVPPCRTVFETGQVVQVEVADLAAIIQTGDSESTEREAMFYTGIPLLGTHRDVIGHLAVIGRSVLEASLIPILQIFAARASAELERMRAEQNHAIMENRYHQLFENSPQPILVFDTHTLQYTHVNAAALKMYGYSRAEFLQLTALQLRPDTDVERFWIALRDVVANHISFTGQWKHKRKDGTIIDIEAHCSTFAVGGRDYVMSIISDVSERQQIEEERHHAALEERNRLARELHDSVNQTLWSAALIADVLPDLYQQDPENGMRKLMQLRHLNRMALAEMRALLLELRPNVIREASITDLFQQLIDGMLTPNSLRVTLDVERAFDMSPELKMALYRIAQQAFNNILRHSGATHVQVGLWHTQSGYQLTIQDDGKGFDPSTPGLEAAGHLGLHIMRERAEQVDADLTIYSEVDCGTAVQIVWQD